MEDVLDQYEKPLNPAEPVICLDEQPYQLLDDTRPSQRAGPGKAAKQDYEYRRCGTCSVFLAVEPRAGNRFVRARCQRTRVDFARFVRDLARRYPQARWIHLVLDNLNTHNPQSLIRNLRRTIGQRLLKRIVWHYTPKHASWLNMAEIELSVLTKQCLDRRLPARSCRTTLRHLVTRPQPPKGYHPMDFQTRRRPQSISGALPAQTCWMTY